MYLQTKEDRNRYLGVKPWFKKLLKTENVLEYVSGVQELTSVKNSEGSLDLFHLVQYPKGIAFVSRKQKHQLGLSFDDIKNYEVFNVVHDLYEIHVYASFRRSICFSFTKRDISKVVPFFRFLPIKEEEDPRDNETAKQEILQLASEFSESRLSSSTFNQNLKSVAKRTMLLDINENRIKWGDKEMDVSSATGYSLGINEVNIQGVSNFDYTIIVHCPDKPFVISFSTISIFHKTGEMADTLEDIDLVLFDVISRPILSKWLKRIANGETIDFKEFEMSRKGLLLKTKSPRVMIHWDELRPENQSMYRWPYTNTVFFSLQAEYDRRGNMLFYLSHWLQQDSRRCLALMGREYYVN